MKNIPPQIKITFIYAVFGILWIFLSDRALELVVRDPSVMTQIQTVKGWIFIAITSLLLFYLVNREQARIKTKEQEKQTIFKATTQAMHHILLNFLNQMQLFEIEAKDSKDFNKETLSLYDGVINEAKEQIENLSSITELTKEEIEKTVYPK